MKNILEMRISFITNQIIRKKNGKYIYIYIYGYLINCEYFNNLNKDGDMSGMGIMVGICTSPYLIEKVGDSPYPYPVNAGIPRQNRDGFGQYPWGQVYLPSLGPMLCKIV